MKKIIYLSLLFFMGCSPHKKELKELHKLTDAFVEPLYTTYDSYGMLGGSKYLKRTTDGQYQVMPVGRLINVKILKEVGGDAYKELEEDLENYYKNNSRVNNVYIRYTGTIMIDCRN